MDKEDLRGQKRFDVLGTLTHVERTFRGSSRDFHGLGPRDRADVDRVLRGSNSLIVLVEGDTGREFAAFVDLNRFPVEFKDIVAARLKVERIFNTLIFIATKLHIYRGGR
jgi:hypothetical protein